MKRLPTVGVAVGRFQEADLHAGHRHLLSEVSRRHDEVLILLGCSKKYPDAIDPLDYELRRQMLSNLYPHAVIHPIFDHTSNESWCAGLDKKIEELFPGHEPVLYGARDSYLSAYVGRLKTEYISSIAGVSGTSERERVKSLPKDDPVFREGVIYQVCNRPPVVYPTADIAIVDWKTLEFILGSKPIDDMLRFIGGFVDIRDETIEETVRREASEEAPRIRFSNLVCLGSKKVRDYRYRTSPDGIMSTLFMADYVDGDLEPGDDLSGLHRVPFRDVYERMVWFHQPLADIFLERAFRELPHKRAA